MTDIDAVLGRLVTDEPFRVWLQQDPQAALAGYDLTTAELRQLVARLAVEADGDGMERRTGRSALFSLLARDVGDATEPDGDAPDDNLGR
jgi:hypothetical protein